jgi:hypothetical protein
MAKVSRRFVNETLWPEFQEISKTLQTYLSDVTERGVRKVIHQDSSEAAVVDERLRLACFLSYSSFVLTPDMRAHGLLSVTVV